MIKGISHLTFIVKNLDKATRFFESVFQAHLIYDSGADIHSLSKERYLLINHTWIAIMEGKPKTGKTYDHIAFEADVKEFDQYVNRIHALGLKIEEGRCKADAEGQSIYFYDYDNHLFEIHAGDLYSRLALYKDVKSK